MAWARNRMLGYWAKLYAQTDAERAIEPAIAALGRRYRSQHPFWNMSAFADFALIDDKIVIEVDGRSHDAPAQKEKDLLHMLQWSKMGWQVVRLTNEQATQEPERALSAAIQTRADGTLVARPPVATEGQLLEALDRLRADYPHLLELAAKRPRRGRPPGAKTRRTSSARARPAGSRTRSSPSQLPQSPPPQSAGDVLAQAPRWE